MQPITQASLDPKFNDIRHLLAEQSTDGVIGCFGLSILYRRTTRAFPTSPVLAMNSSTIRTHQVRILHLRYKTNRFPWKNEGLEATLATHRTTHQGARQRTRRRSTCRHGHAWIGRKAKAIGQKCKKPWENQGFLAERTGTELFDVFPMFFWRLERLIFVENYAKTQFEIRGSP
jgi:hypothetical protein